MYIEANRERSHKYINVFIKYVFGSFNFMFFVFRPSSKNDKKKLNHFVAYVLCSKYPSFYNQINYIFVYENTSTYI